MYPILELKSGREKSLLKQHPWVFSGAVERLPDAQNGDMIQIHNHQGKLMGYGFYSPQSQITARIFEFTQQPLILDKSYWMLKIQKSYQIRQAYVQKADTNAYRLLHAEGDFFPGVIIDIYQNCAVVQLLVKGTEKIYPQITEALQNLGFEYIYLKTKDNSRFLEDLNLPGSWVDDRVPKQVEILENGLNFYIDVEKGQKTGFFLDQRENRQLLRTYSFGKKILNTFSYTGGFSVYALAGGAKEVHSVDISKEAIALGDEIIRKNFDSQAPHQSYTEDCFDFLKRSSADYDIIVLDPPAFAKNKKAIPNASRGYISLNELGLRKLKPGGLLFTFSCSGSIDRDLFRKIVFTAAAEVKRNIRILHQLSQPLDHPINIYHPEGEYLKGLVLQIE
ncbi:MAG: class I SAM-dependent rRNA methyltransferase [Microscillaceae bacterium]|nr:class I SAM-dependent rRNA methyltransferase [Microscillaceae bacterium]